MTIKVQSLKIWMNLEKLVSSLCPTTSHRYTQNHDSAESIPDSNLEGGELRNRCTYGDEKKIMVLLENAQLQGNLMQWLFRKEKQVHNGLKLITQDESA